MITLAFDSTAKAASVAVTDGYKLLGEYTIDNGLTQSELLLPMAENLLSSLKLSFSDVELFACSVGPGSFTGVRIGVSVIKGLAFGRNTPVSAVSTLEALAENLCGTRGIIVPVMDARRSQVYTAIFGGNGEAITRITEDMAIPISELANMLSVYGNEPIYLVGDGYGVVKSALISLGIKTEATPPLLLNENAYSVARVGYRIFLDGGSISEKELAPVYLRKPQAERERLEREAMKNSKERN